MGEVHAVPDIVREIDECIDLLEQDWFIEHVMRNAESAGAMRSLLGPNYREPEWLTWFRGEAPEPAGQWHIDGCSKWGPGCAR